MFDLMRAEWKKTTGNRMATGLLVWIFPIGAIAISILAFVVLALSEDYRTTMGMQTAFWQRSFENGWAIVNSEIGRGIMLVFAAITLAGEYVWGTWKNIIPRSRRWKLLLAKFIMISLVIVFSYLVFTLVIGFTDTMLKVVSGAPISPEINGETLRETAATYLVQAGTSFGAAWIAVGYAAIAAMLTRSVVGSIVISFVALLAEQAVLLVCFLLVQLLGFPEQILYVYYFTPSYNLTNINSWMLNDMPFHPLMFNTETIGSTFTPHSLGGSIAIIAVYVVLIAAITILLFRRQDITS
jgi:ABC-type transport system involved in multi-copper enzyme maturation permease subunit